MKTTSHRTDAADTTSDHRSAGDSRTMLQAGFLAFVAMLLALLTRPAQADIARFVAGVYDADFNGSWDYYGDTGEYFDSGRVSLYGWRMRTWSYGDNGIEDYLDYTLDRPIDNNRIVQMANARGRVSLYDWRNGTWSYGTGNARLRLVKLTNGQVFMMSDHRMLIRRGWWQGLWIEGYLDGWK